MLTPTFHFNILNTFVSTFNEQSRTLVRCLEREARSGREFDLYPYVKRCALDIICGELKLDSKPGEGTTATLRVPLNPEDQGLAGAA